MKLCSLQYTGDIRSRRYLTLPQIRIKIGECLCGAAARDINPLFFPTVKLLANLPHGRLHVMRIYGIMQHFPLMTGGKCVGVLCVFTRTDKKPV